MLMMMRGMTAKNFDPVRYAGRWFEVASLKRGFAGQGQEDCHCTQVWFIYIYIYIYTVENIRFNYAIGLYSQLLLFNTLCRDKMKSFILINTLG